MSLRCAAASPLPPDDDNNDLAGAASGRRPSSFSGVVTSDGSGASSASSVELGRAAIAAGLVPLHAGAVERGGSVVALCGPSGAGKSTFTAAAVSAGWRYVADEVCPVDPSTLAVRPTERPIRMRRGGARVVGIPVDGEPTADWLPERAARSSGGVLTAVVVVSRRPGAPALTSLDDGVGLAEVTRHLVVPDADLRAAFHRLERVVRAATIHTAEYDEVADGVHLLDRIVAP